MDPNYTPLDVALPKKPYAPPLTKEGEPMRSKEEMQTEIRVAAEHQPDKEVEEYIEVKPDAIDVTPDLQQAGVEATTQTSQFQTVKQVKVPLSDDKVQIGLQQPVTSSFRWLAELTVYLLKLAHISLRKVENKLVRVQTA